MDAALNRRRLNRGGLVGLLLGIGLGWAWWAPAAWMGSALASLSHSRLLLTETEGSMWRGQGQLVLAGGPGSLDRMALGGRVAWRWRLGRAPDGAAALQLQLEHPSALARPVALSFVPGWGSMALHVHDAQGPRETRLRLPAAWLVGLGTPWNTLQPEGMIDLQSTALSWTVVSGQPPRVDVSLRLELQRMAARVSTLPVLGDYEMRVEPTVPDPGLRLIVVSRAESALQVQGFGRWHPGQRFEFQGEAQAATGQEAALSNLLNIIGRRDGPRSVITL